MSADAVHYLKAAGFQYKAAESPDLWTHLVSQMTESQGVGTKFSPASSSALAAMIAQGEAALLQALVDHHRRTGALDQIATVIDMPYIVGIEGVIPLEGADPKRLLRLVDHPGTSRERIIHVLPAEGDAIPCTKQVTVTGGLYPDQHTVGYYGLHAGGGSEKRFGGKCAYLATSEDIKELADEMEQKADDISAVTRKECNEMLARVKRLLG
jgi:hypothetical protein